MTVEQQEQINQIMMGDHDEDMAFKKKEHTENEKAKLLLGMAIDSKYTIQIDKISVLVDRKNRIVYLSPAELAPIRSKEKLRRGAIGTVENVEADWDGKYVASSAPIKDKEEKGWSQELRMIGSRRIIGEPLGDVEPKEDTTEARLRKLEQEMSELYPRVSDLVKEVFKETKVNKGK